MALCETFWLLLGIRSDQNQLLHTLRLPRTSENTPSETVWKSERGRSMTYAPEHEKELLDRSIRLRMGVSGTPCSGSQ